MTESAWQACQDPAKMVGWLTDQASERKFRLLACACFRAWEAGAPYSKAARAAVGLAERYADGEVPLDELVKAYNAVSKERDGVMYRAGGAPVLKSDRQLLLMAWMATLASSPRTSALVRAAEVLADPGRWEVVAPTGVKESLLDLFRCIFDNPFRPLVIPPEVILWNDATPGRLAQAIYEARRWEDMSLLGDALEEAGLDDAGVLAHCHGGGPHARGCHVVDAILRKS